MSPFDRRAFLKLAGGLVLGAAAAPQLLVPERRFWPLDRSMLRAPGTDPLLIARMAIQAEIDRLRPPIPLARHLAPPTTLLGLPVTISWRDARGELPPQALPGPLSVQSSFEAARPQMKVGFSIPEGAIGARLYTTSYARDALGHVIERQHLLGSFTRAQIQDMVQGEAEREQWNERLLAANRWFAGEDALSFVQGYEA